MTSFEGRLLFIVLHGGLIFEVQSCSSSIGGQSLWSRRSNRNGGSILKDPCESNEYSSCSKADLANGRKNADKISFSLYHGISLSDQMRKRNIFFIPMEVASIISLVVDGTPQSSSERVEKASSLVDMRCYIRDLRKSLNKRILVDTSNKNNYHKALLMLIQRRMFVDKTLKINFDYAKDTFCWYDIPLNKMDFKDVNKTFEEIDAWGKEEALRAERYITNLTSTRIEIGNGQSSLGKKIRIIKESKIIIASSTILKLAWMNKLFCVENTQSNEPFYTDVHIRDGSERIVRVSFMKTSGKFPFVETESYKAVALPLDTSIHKGRVLLLVPKTGAPFSKVESHFIDHYDTYQQILRSMSNGNSTKDVIEIHVPAMKIRIPQELSIPSDQNMFSIKDKKGSSIPGNEINIFQDIYLEMMESSKSCLKLQKAKDDKIVKFDHPFLLFIEVREDLIGFGRIQNPLECINCMRSTAYKGDDDNDDFYIDVGGK